MRAKHGSTASAVHIYGVKLNQSDWISWVRLALVLKRQPCNAKGIVAHTLDSCCLCSAVCIWIGLNESWFWFKHRPWLTSIFNIRVSQLTLNIIYQSPAHLGVRSSCYKICNGTFPVGFSVWGPWQLSGCRTHLWRGFFKPVGKPACRRSPTIRAAYREKRVPSWRKGDIS